MRQSRMAQGFSRRDLLSGMGALALSPSFLLRQGNDKPVGWAVLGLGSYAQNQIMPAFANCKQSKLVALISGSEDKLQRLGERYSIEAKNRYLYGRMEEIRDNPEIDVVYVITPPGTHPEFSIRAAKAGKHVCSEKPMAPTVADCQAMIDACKKAGKLLQLGYRSQYETHNLRAMRYTRSGELGAIKSLSSDHGFNIGRGSWRTQRALSGGGSMMDIGIYSVQALRYLSWQEPVEVTATITNPPNDERFKEVEDDVKFSLRFPSGLVAQGTSGYSWRPGKNQYEIAFEKGTLRAVPATAYNGNRLTLDGTELSVPSNDQFAAQMDHFSDCIRSARPVRTPGEEGLKDIRIIQAIYEAAKTNKAVRI